MNKIIVSSEYLFNTIESVIGDYLGNGLDFEIVISCTNGLLQFSNNRVHILVESKNDFSKEYTLETIVKLSKLLKTLSNQPITIQFSDFMQIYCGIY